MKIKIGITRIIASTIPIITYIVYLCLSNTLSYFIDYAIVGVKFFTHKYTIIEFIFEGFINIIIVIFPLIVAFLMTKRYINTISIRNQIIIFSIIIIAGAVVAYPLCDYSHFILAITPFVPCLFMTINLSDFKLNQKVICIFFSALLAFFSVFRFVPISNDYKISELKHFSYIPIKNEYEEHIECIDNFIIKNSKDGKEVIIVERVAAMYTIPLDMYRKNFDMLLVGNLGSATIEELLKQNENSIYLVPNKEQVLERQTHFELIEYIRENLTYSGDVLNYEVYQK